MEQKIRGYVNLSISRRLTLIVDEVVKTEKYGYRSRAEFVNDAIRIRLRDLGFKV